jgi:hypothetical protein
LAIRSATCSFCRAGLLGRVERVIELVPSAAQAPEGSQGRAELGPDYFLEDVVTAGGGGAQALLSQEGDAGLPGRVVGEDDTAVRCRLGEDARRFESAPRPVEPRCAVSLRALDPLECPAARRRSTVASPVLQRVTAPLPGVLPR